MKTYENFNKRLGGIKNKPYQIHIKYEHGDADFTTTETFDFNNETDFVNAAKFFYECFNFVPKLAYANLGYFKPISNEVNNGHSNEKDVRARLINIANKYNISEEDVFFYIQRDRHYNRGYAGLEGIKATINGTPMVFVFKQALETNKVSLPNIGDTIEVDVDHIPGYGPIVFGGTYKDYMPNSGEKDYLVKSFDAKVLDCGIHFYTDMENKYYSSYKHFQYILLLETKEDVLKDNIKFENKPTKLVYQIHGYDPDFETKFNKEKYDGLNYYEIN